MAGIAELLRRIRIYLVVLAPAALITVLALVMLLAGWHVAGFALLILATQLLIVGSTLVLYRAVLKQNRQHSRVERELAGLRETVEDTGARGVETTVQVQAQGEIDFSRRAAREHLQRVLTEEAFAGSPNITVQQSGPQGAVAALGGHNLGGHSSGRHGSGHHGGDAG